VTGAGGFLIPNLSNHDPGTTEFSVSPATDNAGHVAKDLKNFAPRLGVAYLLHPTTVLRAGYARSFDAGYAGDLFGIAATQNPPVTVDQNIQSGGFNLSAPTGPPAFVFPSQSQFSLLDLASLNIGNPNQSPIVPPSGAVLYALPPRVRVPTVDSWNLTVQHQLASRMYFELAYVGNKGTHVFTDSAVGTYYDLNQTTLQGDIMPVVNNDTSACRKNGIFKVGNVPTYCLKQAQYRGFYSRVEANPDPCLPAKTCFFDTTLFPVRYFGNDASDNYHSLQAKLQKNFGRGYSFLAHYTWSKGFDYDSDYFRVDPRVGYGPASFDITHRFVLTNIWDLPIGRGKPWLGEISPLANRFVGGWMLSAVTIWQSGFPFTPSYRQALCTLDADNNAPCRPNQVALAHVSGSREQYFTTTDGQSLQGSDCIPNSNVCGVDPVTGQSVAGPANGPWQRPGAGQIGNAGRNTLRGPGFFQSDIAVSKMITMTERSSLRFRADVFNAFNKVNLANPNPCVDCADGGSIGSLTSGAVQRIFQFSLRVDF
jgi:outer membrane receptor protein involved in Fe transport